LKKKKREKRRGKKATLHRVSRGEQETDLDLAKMVYEVPYTL
jgi:hypothetical protein